MLDPIQFPVFHFHLFRRQKMYPIFLHEHFSTSFSASLHLTIKHVTTSILPSCPSTLMALQTFSSIPQTFCTSLKTSRQSYSINLQCLALIPPLQLWHLSNSEWLPEFQVNVYINCWVYLCRTDIRRRCRWPLQMELSWSRNWSNVF